MGFERVLLMFFFRVIGWSVLLSALFWSSQAFAGWIIDEIVKGGQSEQHRVVLQANRKKTLIFAEGGRPNAAFIVDLDAQTITQVDYEERSYATETIQNYVQTIRKAQQMASRQMNEAMRQMQEAMRAMPPEQRKMMEEMMRSQMPQAGAAAQQCREPRIQVWNSGQQATIAGYAAVRYDVLADGKVDSELWIAKGITAWQEIDPRKMERFANEMAKLAGCGPVQRRQVFARSDPAWKLMNEGYPIRTVDRSGGGATTEVLKAEHGAVAASEFQPPPGFVRRTLQQIMGQ